MTSFLPARASQVNGLKQDQQLARHLHELCKHGALTRCLLSRCSWTVPRGATVQLRWSGALCVVGRHFCFLLFGSSLKLLEIKYQARSGLACCHARPFGAVAVVCRRAIALEVARHSACRPAGGAGARSCWQTAGRP